MGRKPGNGFLDYTGRRINHVTVTARAEVNDGNGAARWVCRCDCGKEFIVSSSRLRGADAVYSCGCVSRPKGICGYNCGVECRAQDKCDKCGWNPAEDARRRGNEESADM